MYRLGPANGDSYAEIESAITLLPHPGPYMLCGGQLIPDAVLSFSSATTGAVPPLKAWALADTR